MQYQIHNIHSQQQVNSSETQTRINPKLFVH